MTALSAEEQLMLLSAGTESRRRAAHHEMAALATKVDPVRLAALLRDGRILPTLGPRIVAEVGSLTGSGFEVEVEEALVAARRQGAFIEMIGARLSDALADAGIRSTPLKGPALGHEVHGELGRRLSSDIDILVPQDQLTQAVRVVRELDYEAPDDEVDKDGLPLLHFSLIHSRGQLPPVELHWRIHWYERSFSAERLLPPVTAAKGWQPAPQDELASLLLFYARDGFTSLRQASDLAAWWDRFGAALPQSGLEGVATSYPALRMALSAALVVASRTVGLPTDLLDRPLERLGWRGRVAIWLADSRPHASREQLFAEVGLVDGLLTPREGLRDFFRRQVAPPSEVIREHARKAGIESSVSSFGYAIRMLTRYLVALARLARIPGAHRMRFGRRVAGA